ncbi:MAG: hypothetical protein IJ120_05600 [Solobacterium sp.]|nr:hypothetical protein [Solobacterium sp.]
MQSENRNILQDILNNRVLDAIVSAWLIYHSVKMFAMNDQIEGFMRWVHLLAAAVFLCGGIFFMVKSARVLLENIKNQEKEKEE